MGSCGFPPSIIFADGSVFCAGGGTGLFSGSFFVGSLCGRLDCCAGLFCTAHRSGIIAADLAGNIRWCVQLSRFGRCWRDSRTVFSFWLFEPSSGMPFAAGFSSGLAAAPGFSAPLTEAVPLLLTLPGIFAGASSFFRFGRCWWMAASVFPSGFLELSSGMPFAAGFSSGLAAAPGFFCVAPAGQLPCRR